jgi:hypothetical protein
MSALSGKWKFVPYAYGPNWGERAKPGPVAYTA